MTLARLYLGFWEYLSLTVYCLFAFFGAFLQNDLVFKCQTKSVHRLSIIDCDILLMRSDVIVMLHCVTVTTSPG